MQQAEEEQSRSSNFQSREESSEFPATPLACDNVASYNVISNGYPD